VAGYTDGVMGSDVYSGSYGHIGLGIRREKAFFSILDTIFVNIQIIL
jgi:hypothetical protein